MCSRDDFAICARNPVYTAAHGTTAFLRGCCALRSSNSSSHFISPEISVVAVFVVALQYSIKLLAFALQFAMDVVCLCVCVCVLCACNITHNKYACTRALLYG